MSDFSGFIADRKGNLWASSKQLGVYRIKVNNSYIPISKKDSIQNVQYKKPLLGVVQDDSGNVWAITRERKIQCLTGPDFSTQSSTLLVPESIGDISVFHFHSFDNSFWAGATNGLVKIDKDGDSKLFNEDNWITTPWINDIHSLENGRLWISTHGSSGLLINTEGEIQNRIKVSRTSENQEFRFTRSILPISDNARFIATNSGLFYSSGKQIQKIPLPRQSQTLDQVNDNRVL